MSSLIFIFLQHLELATLLQDVLLEVRIVILLDVLVNPKLHQLSKGCPSCTPSTRSRRINSFRDTSSSS